MLQTSKEQRDFARGLRSRPTDAERFLWERLRRKQLLGARFRRQARLGKFVVDFVCFERRLIVEIDGGQHADSSRDARRDDWLRAQSFRVLRFWNNEVFTNVEGVLETIMSAVNSPPPQPSPVKGEGARG